MRTKTKQQATRRKSEGEFTVATYHCILKTTSAQTIWQVWVLNLYLACATDIPNIEGAVYAYVQQQLLGTPVRIRNMNRVFKRLINEMTFHTLFDHLWFACTFMLLLLSWIVCCNMQLQKKYFLFCALYQAMSQAMWVIANNRKF